MNTPIAIVAAVTLIAFLLHISGGVWESLKIKPSRVLKGEQPTSELAIYDRMWTQSLCAFQMLGIDLLLMAIVLYLLAATGLIVQERGTALICAGVFALWGIIWLVQMLLLKRPLKEYLLLPHWAIWFVCSLLVYYGSTQFV